MDINAGQIAITIVPGNPEWFAQQEQGMPAPEVTGGMIDLPQGGQRQSKAAVIGGHYNAGAILPVDISGNVMKKISGIAPQIFPSIILHGGNPSDAAMFLKGAAIIPEMSDIAQADNSDEAKATQMMIEQTEINISSNITLDNAIQQAKQQIISILGGAAK